MSFQLSNYRGFNATMQKKVMRYHRHNIGLRFRFRLGTRIKRAKCDKEAKYDMHLKNTCIAIVICGFSFLLLLI